MAKLDAQTQRYYLEPGDKVEASNVTLRLATSGNFRLADMGSAELQVQDKKTEEHYDVQYDWEAPEGDWRRGRPYYKKG